MIGCHILFDPTLHIVQPCRYFPLKSKSAWRSGAWGKDKFFDDLGQRPLTTGRQRKPKSHCNVQRFRVINRALPKRGGSGRTGLGAPSAGTLLLPPRGDAWYVRVSKGNRYSFP